MESLLASQGKVSKNEELDNIPGILVAEPSFYAEEHENVGGGYRINEFRKKERSEIAEIMFETLKVQQFTFVSAASLKLFSFMRYTGLVVDLGHSGTYISPVINGYTSYKSTRLFKVGGKDIDKAAVEMLALSNPYMALSPLNIYTIKKEFKEKPENWQGEEGTWKYTLPDKKKVEGQQ